jgi:hypothetical protein
MSAKTSVPIGTTSVVGWSASAVAFGTALVAYLTGDHSAQTVTSVEAAGVGLVMLAVTHLGRYAQVRKIEGTLLPVAKEVLGTVEKYDPGVTAQVEAFVKSEVAKVEEKLTSEDPAPDVSDLEVSSATPTLGGQEALKVQYGTATKVPTAAAHPEANS